MTKLRNKIGPPVEGSDFYGRDFEVSEGRSALLNGNHLLIIAPRRVGKSSFAKKMLNELGELGWKGAYIDVQEVTDELGFMDLFSAEIVDIKRNWFGKRSKRTQELAGAIMSKIKLDWKTEAGTISVGLGGTSQQLIKETFSDLFQKVGKLLIVIDELPYFLARLENEPDGNKRISDFLHLLRALRQKSDNKVCWIFCGSIGLDTFAGRHRLTSTLNDLLPFDLAAFDEATARSFLFKLGEDNDLSLDNEQVEYILELIGWPLPYFLQAHFSQLKRVVGQTGLPADRSAIDLAYKNIIQNVPSLRTWDERLDSQLPEHAGQCRSILTILCVQRQGLPRTKIFDALYRRGDDPEKLADKLSISLQLLQHDGYLLTDKNLYAFRSPLLRDYWYETYVR